MNYHRCNLLKANGHCVGYAHVYLELGEEEVDFTDLQLVLAGGQEVLGVEQSDVDHRSKVAKSRDGSQRSSIDGTSERVILDWTSEKVITDGSSERSSEGNSKVTSQNDSSDEDVTVVDESVDKKYLGAELEDFPPPSSNFEENILAGVKESASPTSSSSEWEDTKLPQGLPTIIRGKALKASIFEKYFSVTGLATGNSRSKQVVECKLCRETGKTSRITRSSMSIHMKSLHLPDEECMWCGKPVKPADLYRHQIQCGSVKV